MAARDGHGFRDLLGVKVTYRGKDRAEGEMPVREEVCRPGGILHGGAFMGFADIMGGNATFPHLRDGTTTTTIESKTNFFAAVPMGDTVKAVATPLHVGRTTVVIQTQIFRGDGKLAAVVTQTQLVMEKKA
jgi:uncharacterized protein (TIGR00369 family)